jgi:hypothetical protein
MIYRTDDVDLFVDITLRDRLSHGFWISRLKKIKQAILIFHAENNVISLEEIFENKFEIEAKKNKILHFFNLKHPDLGKMKP